MRPAICKVVVGCLRKGEIGEAAYYMNIGPCALHLKLYYEYRNTHIHRAGIHQQANRGLRKSS